jgi:hypothetical protein
MRLRKQHLWFSLTIIVLLALAFGSSRVGGLESGTEAGGPPPEGADSYNPAYNDYAYFIAGSRTPGGSLASYEVAPAWRNYAAAMNRDWERFQQEQLGPMREWASQELSRAGTSTAFYPFSGPDFLNLYTLFPRAKTYILVALEPVGVLPDFAKVALSKYFGDLQKSLWQYLYIDYFVTARMKAQIAQTELEGVLPVLLFFMVREHTRILDIRYLALKPNGILEERQAIGGGNPGAGIQGLRIVFATADSPENRNLYYFRVNLQNGSWRRNPQFAAFLQRFGPLTTFTKSASYLLFSRYSSDLRQFILDQSRYVLQDDSGIPLKDFNPAIWNLKFYGVYRRPISLFSNRYQKDLAEAYSRGKNVYPLPFGIGYQFRPGTSNLIFAAKKE